MHQWRLDSRRRTCTRASTGSRADTNTGTGAHDRLHDA